MFLTKNSIVDEKVNPTARLVSTHVRGVVGLSSQSNWTQKSFVAPSGGFPRLQVARDADEDVSREVTAKESGRFPELRTWSTTTDNQNETNLSSFNVSQGNFCGVQCTQSMRTLQRPRGRRGKKFYSSPNFFLLKPLTRNFQEGRSPGRERDCQTEDGTPGREDVYPSQSSLLTRSTSR